MNNQQLWTAFATIVRREIRRFLRIWPQTLLPPVITMVLYFVIFGKLIGGRIGEMAGLPYIQFVAPGLIMMSVITNSYSNVVSSFYSSKFQKNIEELLVSPTPNAVILAGYVAGGMCRGLGVGLIVTTVAMFFADLSLHSLPTTIAIVLMTSLTFSLAGLINAVFANSFDDISIIPTFVLTPLTYLGGVFYSINLLGSFWVTVSLANPILYMVNAFRYGLTGITDINIVWAFAMLALFSGLLFGWALYLLERGARLRS
ncbi:ABC transporter permease [Gammaproteobacteria bacterium LSUCC0057]|uniref:Transport permease protein n=1 Tax=Gammaproteobacteria bacterium LSUCC0057 TaxID=2559237 RepID=A0A4Y8UK03_9GAMM|nr:ABC transporter permease [Gammaproteobacteria bacterium LSUCC0057]